MIVLDAVAAPPDRRRSRSRRRSRATPAVTSVEGVVGELLVDVRVDHQHRGRRLQEDAAVGRSTLHALHGDLAAGARLVLDQCGLGIAAAQMLGDATAERVGRAARREAGDDLHDIERLGALRTGASRESSERGKRGGGGRCTNNTTTGFLQHDASSFFMVARLGRRQNFLTGSGRWAVRARTRSGACFNASRASGVRRPPFPASLRCAGRLMVIKYNYYDLLHKRQAAGTDVSSAKRKEEDASRNSGRSGAVGRQLRLPAEARPDRGLPTLLRPVRRVRHSSGPVLDPDRDRAQSGIEPDPPGRCPRHQEDQSRGHHRHARGAWPCAAQVDRERSPFARALS